MEGYPLKLSDYRGQTLLLIFWGNCGGCRPEMRPLLKLVEEMKDKAFAIVGVYSDDHLADAKSIADELAMPWPTIQDRRNGPIGRAWNSANEWPLFDIIDANGIIRARNLSSVEAPGAVEALMKD